MNNLIDQLKAHALTSNITQKHASAIFNSRGVPICFGVNKSISSASGIDTVHSEHAAINQLGKSLKGSRRSYGSRESYGRLCLL